MVVPLSWKVFKLLNKKSHNNIFYTILASNNGHTEVVRLLIKQGVDVNCKKTGDYLNGWTALMFGSIFIGIFIQF